MSKDERTRDRPPRIFPCTCKHQFQDERYGKGLRVHNYGIKDKVYRCTVCGNERRATDW